MTQTQPAGEAAHLGLRAFTIDLRRWAVWLALAMVVVAALFIQPALVGPEQWPILLRQAAPLGVIALGQTVLLIGRGFDLSVGGVVGFVSVLAAGPFAQANGALPVVLVCLAFGVLVGLANGLVVAFGRVSPLVVTLGMGFVLTGAMLIYTGGAPSGAIPDGIRMLSRDKLLGISYAVFVWFGLAVLLLVALHRSWVGRYLYAIGASPRAALHSGVPVRAIQVGSYVLSSSCAVVGGLLLAGFVGIGTLGAGQELTMNSLAAAVVGGTLLSGGIGGLGGTIGGVLLLTTLTSLLTGAGAGAAGSAVVYGLVLLGAALLFREVRSGSR